MTRFVLALLVASVIGCNREPAPERQKAESTDPELDLGAVRVAIVDGLEAAAQGQHRMFAGRLASFEVAPAFERLLARATADPELGRIADEFFAALQDSPAMRAALLEHARQNPEFIGDDLSALRETFIADVERRLTREELVHLLETQLRKSVERSDQALAQAWVTEAGFGSAVADDVVARLEDSEFRATVSKLAGRDLQPVLVRRFSDPRRAARWLLVPPSFEALIAIVDHERTAQLLAESLGRLLADKSVRERCEELFALALAGELDVPAFEDALARLFDEPALVREATAFLSAVAREEHTRQVVAGDIVRIERAERDHAILEAVG